MHTVYATELNGFGITVVALGLTEMCRFVRSRVDALPPSCSILNCLFGAQNQASCHRLCLASFVPNCFNQTLTNNSLTMCHLHRGCRHPQSALGNNSDVINKVWPLKLPPQTFTYLQLSIAVETIVVFQATNQPFLYHHIVYCLYKLTCFAT